MSTAQPTGLFAPLSAEERRASLTATLRAAPGAVWVFGYGALMWRPCFAHRETLRARVEGHERRMCVWTTLARGSPERPGLALGLVEGGSGCDGLALRIDDGDRETALEALWALEMHTGVYRPHWLPARAGDRSLTVLAFVVDPAHPQFAGDLDPARAARLVASASGRYGTCRDYLSETVRSLREVGFSDAALEDLLARVEARYC